MCDPDNWTQRLKEDPPDPLEDLRQEHKAFLFDLEQAALEGLIDGNWDKVESCLFFYHPQSKNYDV